MPTGLDRLRDALSERYDILRELGHGGMAAVYLAMDRKHGREVAIKVILPDVAASVGTQRFLREIEMAARLRHPHIVPLYDSGDADGLLYYVMPFLGGESLRDRLEREKQLPIDEATRLAREVADALDHAHGHGVVHRDIKPENIMLEAGHAVVTDFGIAKGVAAPGSGLTATGISVGTPSYMSPEQAAGAGDVDGRADLYSLACVLYEMLTGRPPFVGPSAANIIQQHLTLAPVALTALRPAVPASVSAAVSRALAKDAADRFDSVAQFSELLRPRSAATPAAPTRTRGRLWILATSAALAVIAGAWVVRAMLATGQQRIESLAVLPLGNHSGDPSQEYFVNGVYDALTGELARISGLRVASRTSATALQALGLTLPAIADSLGVDAMIEGSVFRSSDTVRLQIRLVGVRPERLIWSRTYDRDVRNVLATMGSVASEIAGEVRVTLSAQEQRQLAGRGTADPEAQEHYLRGRELVYRRDAASVREAINELTEALRVDSAYASAWASLALALALGVNYAGLAPSDSVYAWYARGLAAAERAMALDSLNPEGFAVRGYLGMYAGGPADSTELVLRRALTLRPNYSEAWGWLAQAIAARQPRAALAAMDTALQLDPASAGMRMAHIIVAYMVDSAALQHAVAAPLVQLRPDLPVPVAYDALALAQLGRPVDCLALPPLPASILATCQHVNGQTVIAERTLRRELAALRAGRLDISTQLLPIALAAVGRLDDAIESVRAVLKITPNFILPVETHRLVRSEADPDATRFWRAVREMRAQAWTERVRAARAAVR